MGNNDAGLGRPVYSKGVRATKIRQTQERVLDRQQGKRHEIEHQSEPAAVGNGNIWGTSDDGTLG